MHGLSAPPPAPPPPQVVGPLASRSTGIVGRDVVFSLAAAADTQERAVGLVEDAVRVIAPYQRVGHKVRRGGESAGKQENQGL
jgi:hypothetical protein